MLPESLSKLTYSIPDASHSFCAHSSFTASSHWHLCGVSESRELRSLDTRRTYELYHEQNGRSCDPSDTRLPYGMAIRLLRTITFFRTPAEKAQVLLEVQ